MSTMLTAASAGGGSLECAALPRWSFIEGIIVGQTTMVVLIVLLIVYVVFEDPNSIKKQQAIKSAFKRTKAARTLPFTSHQSKKKTVEDPTAALLSAIAYDLHSHPPESLDWLNLLFAQTLHSYRTLILDSKFGDGKRGVAAAAGAEEAGGGARGFMERVLNRRTIKEEEEQQQQRSIALIGIDRIVVSDVDLGDKFPIITNARVRPSGSGDGVRIELDVDYTDLLSLSLTTSLLVNFPRPRFAILPLALSITLERFSGTFTVELPSSLSSQFHPSYSHARSQSHSSSASYDASAAVAPIVHLSLQPDFALQLCTSSLLGSRAKLQDIPKIEQLILARIRGAIEERLVRPGRVEIRLPGLFAGAAADVATPSTRGDEREEGFEGEKVDGSTTDQDGWEWTASTGPNVDPSYNDEDDDDDSDLMGERSASAADFERSLAANGNDDDGGESATGEPATTVLLSAKIRKRPNPSPASLLPLPFSLPIPIPRSYGNGVGTGSGYDRPPSPTESIPGHFSQYPQREERNRRISSYSRGAAGAGGGSGGEMRYRNASSTGGGMMS